jgi:hypothetical protein
VYREKGGKDKQVHGYFGELFIILNNALDGFMRKLPGPTEKSITKDIRGWLKLKGICHWKVMQGLGCTPGVPDIICIVNGVFIGIEVKTPKGKLSVHQEQFKKNIEEARGIYLVARDLMDVVNFFEGEGNE